MTRRWTKVSEVDPLKVHSEFQTVIALRPGKVIDDLILGDVAALRVPVKLAPHAREVAVQYEATVSTLSFSYGGGKNSGGCREICRSKNRTVVRGSDNQLVDQIRAESMRLGQLTRLLGLDA